MSAALSGRAPTRPFGAGGFGLHLAPAQAPVLDAAARRLRAAARMRLGSALTAAGLERALKLWRERPARRRTEAATIAAAMGLSTPLLDESLAALLKGFDASAIEALAGRAAERHSASTPELVGFVMPGNVPGAGLHELCAALIAGAGVIVKTASSEPFFFAAFAAALAEAAPELVARLAVFNWSRADEELNVALRRQVDALVLYGDDATLAAFKDAGARNVVGFGSRMSAALVTREAASSREVAGLLARDVTLFEQRGCLSPHQVFVEEAEPGAARRFAATLAAELQALCLQLPPPRLALSEAVAIRRVRDVARWERLGSEGERAGDAQDRAMWEGDALAWTVVYEPRAELTISPGYRTVFVSALKDLAELRARLGSAAERIEGFAIAGPRERAELSAMRRTLAALGVSYLCEPGMMQSPPPDWRHGNGAFLSMLGL